MEPGCGFTIQTYPRIKILQRAMVPAVDHAGVSLPGEATMTIEVDTQQEDKQEGN
jgi:hypothetical protein